MRVKDLMSRKLITIDVDRNLRDARRLMEKKKIARLLVTDEDEVIGIITERDIANRLGAWFERKISDATIHISAAYSPNLIKIDGGVGLDLAAELMLKRGISSLVVTDKEEVVGLLTKTDLAKSLLGSKVKVEKYMSKPVTSLSVGARLLEARNRMFREGIKRIPIVLREKLVGMVTEKDIAHALGLFRKMVEGKQWDEKLRKILVEDIMSKDIITIDSKTSLGECVGVMLERGISGLPVVENGKLVGIITKTDLVRAVRDLKP